MFHFHLLSIYILEQLFMQLLHGKWGFHHWYGGRNIVLLKLYANPDFFAVLFVYCFEVRMEKGVRISFWSGSWAAMGNLRPLKLFRAALLKAMKFGYFIEKSTKCVVKVYTLALDMTFYQKFGPRTYLGCPWLFLGIELRILRNSTYIKLEAS